jgi:mycothiol synthase
MPEVSGSPFVFRHYSLEEAGQDFHRLARLLKAVETWDQDGEDVSEAALLASLKWQGHDLQKDRWLAFHRDHLDEAIGYTFIFTQSPQRATLHVAVHPDWRRRGLGRTLLHHSLERACELGVHQVLSNTNARNAASIAFLHRQGFQLAGAAWSLHLPSGQPVAEPEWPAGYTVRRYIETPDLTLLTTVLNQCYADRWGHTENTPGAVDEARVARALEYWRPEDLFIAFAPHGQAVGVCENRPATDPAEDHLLGAPGIAPAYRLPELYRALTLTAARWLRRYGPQAIRLESYGDDEGVIAVYQELGFSLDGQFLSYLYDLKQSTSCSD